MEACGRETHEDNRKRVKTVGDVWYGTHGLVTNVTPENRRTRVINPTCVINFTPVIIYPSLHRALEVMA